MLLAGAGAWYGWKVQQPLLTLTVEVPKQPVPPPWWTHQDVRVQGRVLAESGEPVVNAEVLLPGQRLRTDASGAFAGSVRSADATATVPVLVANERYRTSVTLLPVKADGIAAEVRLRSFDAAPRIARARLR